MMKKLMIGAATAALMVSGALAQSPGNAPSPSSTPPAASPSQSAPPAAASDKSSPPAVAAATDKSSGKPDFVTSQKPDQWLASRFKGTDVVGADDKKIGDVSDILFDKTGKIEAFVVSVGGFLGMGAKDVALAPTSFDVMPGTNGAPDKLKLTLSQDQLKQAQNFTPHQPPKPITTGAGGSSPGGLGGGPAGMRPSSNTPPTGR